MFGRAANSATASFEEMTEPRVATRPSSFTQQLQSHVVEMSQPAQFDDVDDKAEPDRQQNLAASSSSLSSMRQDPLHGGGLAADDDRGLASIADEPRPDDVTPIPPTSSPPVTDLSRLVPSLASQTRPDPSAVIVISPLRSLLGGDDPADGRRSAATVRDDDDDDGGTCRQPLSSGWATALAAATIAGKAAAATATKRRPNTGKSAGASFNIRASRSLFCLTTSNPIRKLSISVVEWKYPLRSQLLLL